MDLAKKHHGFSFKKKNRKTTSWLLCQCEGMDMYTNTICNLCTGKQNMFEAVEPRTFFPETAVFFLAGQKLREIHGFS